MSFNCIGSDCVLVNVTKFSVSFNSFCFLWNDLQGSNDACLLSMWGEGMSKKVLLFCVSLVGACFADGSPENAGDVAAQVENTQVDVTAPQVHELPGIRISRGPVVVDPSYGCSNENIEALADATVRALYATLSDVAATVHRSADVEAASQAPADVAEVVAPAASESTASDDKVDAEDNKIEKAREEISEAVDAVHNVVTEVTEAVAAVQDAVFNGSIMGDYVPAIMDFISSYYNWFVTFFKEGWKYMVYNSVNKATRHIVLSVGSRSPVDLSALAQVDAFAGECFSKMHEAKSAILAAAEERSPQLRKATEFYLSQHENWFIGAADAFVDVEATGAMLECLGVGNIEVKAFTTRNMDHFRSLGGEIRHSNLFLIVAPGEIANYEATPFIAQASEEVIANG